MALNHMKLKAAVSKYLPLYLVDKKSEQEIKDALAADEKNFGEEGVEEIYQAIINFNEGDDNDDEDKVFVVISEFRCMNDWDLVFKVGQDVSHLDKDRLKKLVANKLVEVQ